MKLDSVFPAFPPALDGIGDYTAHLSSELATAHDVRVLTAQRDPDPLPETSLRVERAFSLESFSGPTGLIDNVARRKPDWVVLQYNPFSWGRWGFAPLLPRVFRQIRERSPTTHIALTVHEPFVPIDNLSFAVMTTWQRWQFWRLGRLADVIFFAIEAWADRFRSWFPDSHVCHLPVGSNIPRVDTERSAVRRSLGYGPNSLVAGLFGRGHSSRLFGFVRRAVENALSRGIDASVLYVGPATDVAETALAGIPFKCTGALPAHDVSRHLRAMDVYLAPFRKGVSTRRGSFLAGLQHGLPTVSTIGSQTDAMLRREDTKAFLLAPDDDLDAFQSHFLKLASDRILRQKMGKRARHLFDAEFSWKRIADQMLNALTSMNSSPAKVRPQGIPVPSVQTND